MAKQKIELILGFSADTSKAKASLRELETDLNSLLTTLVKTPEMKLTKNMKEAQAEGEKLSTILRQVANVNTGKFDLSKFQKELKKSGTSLEQIRQSFSRVGPEGEQAFLSLASSIVNAEIPAKKMNAHLKEMLKSLKSTAQWQVSSSIMHGFTGAISEAYQYAQDLNQSLNDIRIVTGYNIDKMNRFAKSANKAAKELNTTTNEYAKASLIYFQQGLSDAEVERRTAATVKMANVTGEATEDVSSYMTAIWSNFADGSKELTHYADVITALGAATAASSEEIAEGLQKFSAIANTVGLSYEYATSALATVVAQTRESADTVGTAFKTIFARLESLSLGETLDDGTSLTKYSQALAQVGVNIKDSKGQLKDMDVILDELGEKWSVIGKDQQMALAQTVAGMRQYNNFIALLDNYETFKVNVEVAETSKGTIDEQSEIYAEGWEAARDRVTAALETIYEKLLDDDFFIGLLDLFADILEQVDKLIDSFGGLGGILPLVASTLLTVADKNIAEGIGHAGDRVRDILGITKKEVIALKKEAQEETEWLGHRASGGEEDIVEAVSRENRSEELKLQIAIAENEANLTEKQKAELEQHKQKLELLAKQTVEMAEQVKLAEAEKENFLTELKTGENAESNEFIGSVVSDYKQSIVSYNKEEETAQGIVDNFYNSDKLIDEAVQDLEKEVDELTDDFKNEAKEIYKALEGFLNDVQNATKDKRDSEGEKRKKAQKAGANAEKKIHEAADTRRSNKRKFAAKSKTKDGKDLSKEQLENLEKALDLTDKEIEANKKLADIQKRRNEAAKDGVETAEKRVKIEGTDRILAAASAVTSLVAAVNMLKGVKDVLSSPDMTGWEKFSSIMKTIIALVPVVIMAINGIATAIKGEDVAVQKNIFSWIKSGATKIAHSIADKAVEKGSEAVAKGKQKETAEVTKNTISWYANPIMWIALIIVGIVAAMALLVVGIVALTKALQENSASWQLEQAKKEAEAMATALDEAKARAEALKEAFDQYKSVRDKLAECTKGTEEWNEALRENNAKVIELIQKYPQLVNAMSRGANGELTLDEDQVEAVIADANKAVMTATAASYSANAKVREKQITVDREDITKELGKSGSFGVYANKMSQDLEDFAGKSEAEIAEQLKNSKGKYAYTTYDDYGNAITNTFTDEQADKMAKILFENDKIQKLSDSINANTKATDAETEAIKQSLLADNETVQNSKYADQIIEATSQEEDEKLNARIEAEMASMDEDYGGAGWGKEGISKATVTNAAADKIFEEFATASGIEGADLIDTQGDDNNRVFIYTDAEGNEHKASLEQMKRTVAAAHVKDDMVAEAEELTKIYDKMDDLGAGMLTAATSGNTAHLTRAQLEKIERGEVKAEDLGLTEEDLKALGYDNLEAFKEALSNSVTVANDTWEKTLSSMTSKSQEHLTSLIETYGNNKSFASLTDAQLEAYGNGLDTLYETSGGKAADSLKAIMNELISTNQEEADKIVEIAGGIDWTNGQQGLIDLENQLANAGIRIDETSQFWQELVNEIKNAPEALLNYDFDTVRKEIADIQKLVNDISFSDIITDEDFEKLKKYSAEVKDMFVLTADGYRFIGESEKLVAISLENSRKVLYDSLDNNRESKSVVSKVNAYVHGEQKDYDELSETKDTQAIFNRAASFVSDKDITDDDLAALGFGGGKELLSEYIDKAAAGDVEALNKIKEFYGEIATLKEKVESDDFNNAKDFELYASQFESLEDLNKEYLEYLDKEGLLTQDAADAYNKQAQYLYATVKQRRDNIDFMQEEEKLVERLEKKLDKLADKKDRAYGASRLEAINEEIEATYELIAANELALSQANIDKANAKADLTGEVGDLAEFDENGNLLNSEEILDLWAEKGETAYKEVEKLIEEYDKAQEAADDYAEAIEENNLRIKDLALEKIEYKAEFVIELNETSFDLLEWQLQHLEDKAYDTAKAIQLIGQKIDLNYGNFTTNENKIKDIAANKGINIENKDTNTILTELLSRDDLTDQERTSIDDAISGMMGSVDEIYAANEEMADSVLRHFQDLYDEYDKASEKISEVTKLTSHYKDIIDIVGEGMTNTNKQFLATLSEAEQEAAEAQLKSSKATMEGLQKDRENYLNIISTLKAEEADDTVISVWEEKLTEIDDMITQTQEDMQNAWTDALTAAAETFRLTMEAEIESFEAQMSGAYGTLDELSKAYEQQSVLNSQYVDDYEKIYKLSKITRQIENSMNNASSIKAKRVLAELQAEITAAQQSGKELSEYDLEYLQKKYELKQAEIALEESQTANRTMRLSQDANGNWGYTYTANVEATGEAEQNYEDKLFAMQEYNAQQLESAGALIISIQQEFSNALQEVYNNDTLSAEEKAKKIEEVTAFYTERLQYATEEYDKIVSNNNELYTKDWTNYAAATGYMVGDTNKVNYALEGLFGENGTAASYFNQFLSAVGVDADGKPNGEGMLSSLSKAYDEYKKDLEDIFDMAGSSLSGFGEKVQGEVSGATTAAINAGAAIESLVKKLTTPDASGKTVFDKIVNNIKDKLTGENGLISILNSAKDTINSVIDTYSKYLTTTAQKAANIPSPAPKPSPVESSDAGAQTNYKPVETTAPPKVEATAKEVVPSSEAGTQTKSDQNYTPSYPKRTGDDKATKELYNQATLQDYAIGDRVTTKEGEYPWAFDNKGNLHQIDGAAKDNWDNTKAMKGDNYIYVINEFVDINGRKWARLRKRKEKEASPYYLSANEITRLDTGGYTGSWGPEGRMAMLHQKEIVLNADDTANFLSAIDIVRELVKTIDLQAASASLGLSLGGINYPNNGGQTLQQEVTIHAEFPNATDRYEIEEAFNSLMTRTSQFVNTNR